MRWKQAIIGVSVAVLGAVGAGCAQQGDVQPGSGGAGNDDAGRAPVELPRESGQGAGRKPVQPPASDEGRPVPPERVDGSALPRGYPVEVSVTGDGRTLRIVGQEGGCSKASAELAEQRGDRVAVTMVETKPTSKDIACTMDMRYPPLTVTLDEPLGQRMVVLTYQARQT
ncbi:hypothetical protein SacmaDRAFT_2252 [Saccharomonospora marina XMU15]|uniref:Lipoprotein n=1 Tax=Saccharomonospora marina XMU15 TaxID=882083 RepID=H5XBJ7_9PSEU|nr:hypothetical protein [Saccharomonospora marina]EHR50505.1 hypothetical protein SacmaDRAFT_2252 [Saccharomonospora marina XMU15]